MIIGVDGNEANVKKRVGVSFYTYNLLWHFQKQADANTQFKVFLKNQPLPDMPEKNKYFSYDVVPGRFLWSQIFLPFHLYQKKGIDVFFSPAHYGPRFLNVPLVVTIHDLSYIFYPNEFLKKDLYQLTHWTKYTVSKATKIIAVSNSTKKDLIRVYGLPENKIAVIYNGFEKYTRVKPSKFKIKENKKPYLLYVGTLQPRKNVGVLLQAFYKFNQIYPEFELVIAGKKGWMYEKIFEQIADLGLEDKVYFTDYISDFQLAYLYENAFCLVMPSLYEGFGLPILEAMSFNLPVLSSFSSSLPEIGGEACFYFDPNDVNELVEKLIKLKNNPSLRKELIKKGKERIKHFSWKTCATQTLSVIKTAYQS